MKKPFLFTFICFLFLAFLGCTQEEIVVRNAQTAAESSVNPLLSKVEDLPNGSDSYVVVLLGYGYNEGEKKESLLSQLDENYGLAEKGGTIIPFIYPDDFVSFGYERISLLADNIHTEITEIKKTNQEASIVSMITLGAPEGTHYALAALQDSDYTMQVFSVFSQDDVLGTEAGSSFVIDYTISQQEQEADYEKLGEIDLSYPSNVFDVISPLINASLRWDEIKNTGLFIPALRAEYSKKIECDFFVYIDPQTGLRAENHYVLSQQEKQ